MKLKLLFILLSLLFISVYVYPQNVKTLKGHTGNINAIQFFPDGKSFASGGSDDDIFLWNYNTFERLSTIESDLSDIIDMKIMKNGSYIMTANKRPTVKTIYPDGSQPPTESTIGLWDLKNKKQNYPIKLFSELSSIDVSSDGNNIFYAYNIGSVHYSNWGETYNNNSYIVIYKFSFNENRTEKFEIEYYNDVYKIKKTGQEKDYNYSYPLFVKYIDNNILAVTGSLNDILIINLENKTILKNLVEKVSKLNTTCINLSPNKKLVAIANYSNDSWICIWDLEIGRSIKTLKGHDKDVLCVAFSPDGNYLASGSKDNTIRLWDVNKGKLIKVLTGHENNVNTVCFSPDGKNLISGSDDETIKVWSIIDYLPELKIYAINYDISVGIKYKLQDEYNKEYEETVASYFKPKGEFETTDDYNKRIEEGKSLKIQLVEKYNKKGEEILKIKESELQTESNQKLENENNKSLEIQTKIDLSTKDTLVTITKIGSYNADKQIYTMTIKGYSVDIIVPITDAPSFKENWQKATVKCKKQLMKDLSGWKYFDFIVIHPITKTEYKLDIK